MSIDAPPEAVLDLVADPRNLPRWAPGAATAVRPDGDAWLIENSGGQARIIVRVSREHGTVDLLAAEDLRQGVFTRVLPNGSGSEYQFTLLFPGAATESAVAQQMAVVQDELRPCARSAKHETPGRDQPDRGPDRGGQRPRSRCGRIAVASAGVRWDAEAGPFAIL